MMKSAYVLINAASTLAGTLGVFYLSVFYMGTAERWESDLQNDWWGMFIGRVLLCFVPALLYVGIGLLIFRLTCRFWKVTPAAVWRLAGCQVGYYLVCATMFVLRTFQD